MKKYFLIAFVSLIISALTNNAQENNDPILIAINFNDHRDTVKKNRSDKRFIGESIYHFKLASAVKRKGQIEIIRPDAFQYEF